MTRSSPVSRKTGSPLPQRTAVVTQGFGTSGGIQSSARWLVETLRGSGISTTVFDLANSRRDPASNRLAAPSTWHRRPLLQPDGNDPDLVRVGARAVELEPARYLPRAELSSALGTFDTVQVVAGGPALALAAISSRRPVVLQFATRVALERAPQYRGNYGPTAMHRRLMTAVVSRMELRAVREADAVLVMNATMARFARAIRGDGVHLIPPGVDADLFTPSNTGWTAKGSILSVCRLNDPRKGLDRLLRAYALVRAAAPTAPSLVLAGLGTPPRHLERLSASLGIAEHVTFMPNVPASELPSLYRKASVYWQASHEEGFGLSVIEAMASGLPVVATATDGARETIIDGTTGWLVDQTPRVEASMAERTLWLWDHGGDTVSRNARERVVAEFSTAALAARILAIHAGLLENAGFGE